MEEEGDIRHDVLGAEFGVPVVDWGGVTTMAYDGASRLRGKTDPGLLSQSYDYDEVGNRVRLVDPDGGVRTVSFDRLDRVSGMCLPDGRRYTPSYDANGRRTTLALGLGSVRVSGHDAVGRLTTQVEYAGANPIATFVDSYDPLGNRTRRVQDAVQTDWAYDAKSRLTGQQGADKWATFTMDSVGNLLTKQHQGEPPRTMAYDAANRLVTALYGASKTTTVYDRAGNPSIESTDTMRTSFSYDDENRLTRTVTPTETRATNSYQGYDGLRRTWQEPGASVVTTIWDGDDYMGEVR